MATEVLFQPALLAGGAGFEKTSAGGVVSILIASVLIAASRLPAWSWLQNSIAWTASPAIVNGPAYVIGGPPSTVYCVATISAAPSGSVALSVTITSLTYHPFCPALAANAAVVTGG